jgi:hypothetical protein
LSNSNSNRKFYQKISKQNGSVENDPRTTNLKNYFDFEHEEGFLDYSEIGDLYGIKKYTRYNWWQEQNKSDGFEENIQD